MISRYPTSVDADPSTQSHEGIRRRAPDRAGNRCGRYRGTGEGMVSRYPATVHADAGSEKHERIGLRAAERSGDKIGH
jgi:hypothetical protein